jgi:hypothetical protein
MPESAKVRIRFWSLVINTGVTAEDVFSIVIRIAYNIFFIIYRQVNDISQIYIQDIYK